MICAATIGCPLSLSVMRPRMTPAKLDIAMTGGAASASASSAPDARCRAEKDMVGTSSERIERLPIVRDELVFARAQHPQRFVAGSFELAVVAAALVHRRVHHPHVGWNAVVLEVRSVVVGLRRIPCHGERSR